MIYELLRLALLAQAVAYGGASAVRVREASRREASRREASRSRSVSFAQRLRY